MGHTPLLDETRSPETTCANPFAPSLARWQLVPHRRPQGGLAARAGLRVSPIRGRALAGLLCRSTSARKAGPVSRSRGRPRVARASSTRRHQGWVAAAQSAIEEPSVLFGSAFAIKRLPTGGGSA